MNTSESDESKHIKVLEEKIQELEKTIQNKTEVIESNLLDAQMVFLMDISDSINVTWAHWQNKKGADNSSDILACGFADLREKLGQYSIDNLQWPKVLPEKEDLQDPVSSEVLPEKGDVQYSVFSEVLPKKGDFQYSVSLPPGVAVINTEGKIEIEIETESSNDLVIQYRFNGKNIQPISLVVIRELCRFTIVEKISHAPRDRRIKIESIFRGPEFRGRLKSLLGYYPILSSNESQRILDIVSNHVADKAPEIYDFTKGE